MIKDYYNNSLVQRINKGPGILPHNKHLKHLAHKQFNSLND